MLHWGHDVTGNGLKMVEFTDSLQKMNFCVDAFGRSQCAVYWTDIYKKNFPASVQNSAINKE